MDYIGLTKKIIGGVAGTGATFIISDITKAVMPQNVGKIGRAFRCVGCFVFGSLVGTATEGFSSQIIDEGVKTYNQIVKKEMVAKDLTPEEKFVKEFYEIVESKDIDLAEKEARIEALTKLYKPSK